MPSPVGAKPVQMMWPDCSPPSVQPRSRSSSETWRSPTWVVATSIPASSIAVWKPKFDITVTATPPPSSPASARWLAARTISSSPSRTSPGGVDRNNAVAVAVEREADVGARGDDALGERLGMGGAAALVDVPPVGIGEHDLRLGAQGA